MKGLKKGTKVRIPSVAGSEIGKVISFNRYSNEVEVKFKSSGHWCVACEAVEIV